MLEPSKCKRAWTQAERDPRQGCFLSPPLCLALPQLHPPPLQADGYLNNVYWTRMQLKNFSGGGVWPSPVSIPLSSDEESQAQGCAPLTQLGLCLPFASVMLGGHAISQGVLSKVPPSLLLTLC